MTGKRREEEHYCMYQGNCPIINHPEDFKRDAEEFGVFARGDEITTHSKRANERFLFMLAMIEIPAKSKSENAEHCEEQMEIGVDHFFVLQINFVEFCGEDEIIF